jgi:hypothetical protein
VPLRLVRAGAAMRDVIIVPPIVTIGGLRAAQHATPWERDALLAALIILLVGFILLLVLMIWDP